MEKSDIKVGICAVVKDTPDYLMKEWINHHFNIGISKIIIYIDCCSKNIYYDDRVEYIQITPELKTELVKEGNKYCFEPDCGSSFQVGIYNTVLEQQRGKLDWLACIDDDEFLVLNFDDLKKYNKYTCVLLPWKMMFTPSIKCEKNLNNFYEFPAYYQHVYSNRYTKALLNVKTCWKDRDLHHGDYSGVIIDLDYTKHDYWKNSLCITEYDYIYSTFMNCKNYIRHYKTRSFEEWVESIVDRKYNVYDIWDYSKRTWNREIRHFFSSNPFFISINTKYDKSFLDKWLNEIDRLDIKQTPYYDFASIPENKTLNGNWEIIYNCSGNGMLQEKVIKKNLNKKTNYIIVDYTNDHKHELILKNCKYKKCIILDKNEFILWMRLYVKQENIKSIEENKCLKHLILKMFPNITPSFKILY